MAQRAKRYTVMFIPDDRRRTITLTIPRSVLRSLLALAILFAVGIAYLIVRSGTIAARLQLVEHLKSENLRLREENQKLDQVRASIRRIEQMNEYFERLALESGTVAPPPLPKPEPKSTSSSAESVAVSATVKGRERTATPGRPAAARVRQAKHMLESVPYVRPVQGWVTRTFSAKDPGAHRAVDFAAAEGTPIRATAPGIVESVLLDEYFGKIVTIKHSQGFKTRYGHCSQILVANGEHVHRGQTIAMVGNTGRSSAPHLHYEVIKNAKHVDPLQYIVD
ncbi:MAG: peptidoglycan DD-metalloendopeptidase family protein [Chitinivibrionales bacterium]|nr:peptidoglycan DD-metalloendopeptidase family protein [Chitinivibrionales bacterium]